MTFLYELYIEQDKKFAKTNFEVDLQKPNQKIWKSIKSWKFQVSSKD